MPAARAFDDLVEQERHGRLLSRSRRADQHEAADALGIGEPELLRHQRSHRMTHDRRPVLSRLRRRRTTVRWRLTVLYGALFLGCGAALLAITYALVANANGNHPLLSTFLGHEFGAPVPPEVRAPSRFIRSQHKIADLHQLAIESGVALAIMAIASTLLGRSSPDAF